MSGEAAPNIVAEFSIRKGMIESFRDLLVCRLIRGESGGSA
jgi:hypothetical protein